MHHLGVYARSAPLHIYNQRVAAKLEQVIDRFEAAGLRRLHEASRPSDRGYFCQLVDRLHDAALRHNLVIVPLVPVDEHMDGRLDSCHVPGGCRMQDARATEPIRIIDVRSQFLTDSHQLTVVLL